MTPQLESNHALAAAALRGGAGEGPSAPETRHRRTSRLSKEERVFAQVYGVKLHRAREGRKLSQQKLANMLGVHRNTILRWETGEGLLSLYHHERLASAMDVMPGELL